MTATLPVARRTGLQVTIGQVDPDSRAESYGGGAGTHPAGSGEAMPGGGRGASLAERGYVHARFGGVPVLVGPELAAQLRAIRQKQPRDSSI